MATPTARRYQSVSTREGVEVRAVESGEDTTERGV
jgi:hypothetical protein